MQCFEQALPEEIQTDAAKTRRMRVHLARKHGWLDEDLTN